MKSLVSNIRDYFNRRTKVIDSHKEAHVTRKTLVIENGECAKRLLKNDDFALLFNLYRFYLLEMLEDSKDDVNRIDNAQRVAGVDATFNGTYTVRALPQYLYVGTDTQGDLLYDYQVPISVKPCSSWRR